MAVQFQVSICTNTMIALFVTITSVGCGSDPGEGKNCTPGQMRDCSTNQVGECSHGNQVCQQNGTWGECKGVLPTSEVCDDKDNDCDGLTDEDLEQDCNSACGIGVETCSQGSWVGCTAAQPIPEICDGKDNDCDGLTDEDLPPGDSWVVVAGPDISDHHRLQSVHFPTGDEGWTVGYQFKWDEEAEEVTDRKGIILHFIDGKWNVSPVPEIEGEWELDAVEFPTSEEGWAVGHRYTGQSTQACLMLHFVEGAWNVYDELPFSPCQICDLEDIAFASRDFGWAVGSWVYGTTQDDMTSHGIIYEYAQGKWKRVALNAPADPDPNFNIVWYYKGIAVSSLGSVMAVGVRSTTNGGCYGFGCLTTNGPDAWEHAPVITCDKQAAERFYSVAFDGVSSLWAVGRKYYLDDNDIFTKGGIAKRFDAGQWTPVELPWTPVELPSIWQLNDVAISQDKTTWIIGKSTNPDEGLIFRYKNGIWARIQDFPMDNWVPRSLAFPEQGNGWIVGSIMVIGQYEKGLFLRQTCSSEE